jgi:hypothetical protein
MENFEISELEPITIDFGGSSSRSTNFGSGIELLMNDKMKSSSAATTIDLGELDKLEDELNELSSINMNPAPSSSSDNGTKTLSGFASNLFGFGNNNNNVKINMEDEKTDSKLGHATIESIGNTKTWDGYSKLNEIPTNSSTGSSASSNMSDREKRRKKRAMIKALESWYEKGTIKSISHFTMDSSFEEVEDEYEGALEDKRKKDAVKIQQNWLITMVNTIEYGNAMFDPFGISLDGWGESISEDIDSYSEIFEQLHEKYKGGKLAPEVALILRVATSAFLINMTNKMVSAATPGLSDVFRQSPDLMNAFMKATVDSLNQA